MTGKIAFEEHMAIPETVDQTAAFASDGDHWRDFSRQILDLGSERLEGMDRNGIDYAILSLNSPGVQGILNTQDAIRIARRGNDVIAEAVTQHPNRYGGFAALAMQDAEAAAEELTRCVRELGFHGALINGFTQRDTPDVALYYDLPEYEPFWAAVAELDVPIYIHPRTQIPSRAQQYEGHNWMMSAPWGFAVETSIHALRLCGSDVFERHPTLRIVLGHLGENIPFGLDRMNERMRFSRRGYRGAKLPGENFAEHFHVTVSGNFSDAPFRCTLDTLGADRVSFSSDYPFEPMEAGAKWFDETDVVTAEQKKKIARGNAIDLFKLGDRFKA
jgi:predicted TIM-barrel fold metal-dependent hydrolase